MTAIYNKKENIYTMSIPLYLWIDETNPDFFEPMMTEFTWHMDEFNVHFFGLPEELIECLCKLSLEYIKDLHKKD